MSQQNNANFIWSIADLLRGPYKPHQYGAIVLPFKILRRFDVVLVPTKLAVLDASPLQWGDLRLGGGVQYQTRTVPL